jgi:hypothetical protein
MEEAGADESIINVHQWRGQTGTLYKSYIKFPDRAVKLCRPYINLMFGEKTRLLRAVLKNTGQQTNIKKRRYDIGRRSLFFSGRF